MLVALVDGLDSPRLPNLFCGRLYPGPLMSALHTRLEQDGRTLCINSPRCREAPGLFRLIHTEYLEVSAFYFKATDISNTLEQQKSTEVRLGIEDTVHPDMKTKRMSLTGISRNRSSPYVEPTNGLL